MSLKKLTQGPLYTLYTEIFPSLQRAIALVWISRTKYAQTSCEIATFFYLSPKYTIYLPYELIVMCCIRKLPSRRHGCSSPKTVCPFYVNLYLNPPTVSRGHVLLPVTQMYIHCVNIWCARALIISCCEARGWSLWTVARSWILYGLNFLLIIFQIPLSLLQ